MMQPKSEKLQTSKSQDDDVLYSVAFSLCFFYNVLLSMKCNFFLFKIHEIDHFTQLYVCLCVVSAFYIFVGIDHQ